MTIVRKVTVAEAAGADDYREVREYIISDGSLDRYGTVINPAGWDLTEFRKNPIAFFNHDKTFPLAHGRTCGSRVGVFSGNFVLRLRVRRLALMR
jgi:hypothetical protein